MLVLPSTVRPLPIAERSCKEQVAAMPRRQREEWLTSQPTEVIRDISRGAWWWERRGKQTPPPGDWLVWIIGSGRGWGKNRVGAETLIDWCEKHPTDRHGNRTEWLVVAETLEDCKKLNFGGPSGLINVLRRRGYAELQRPPKKGSRVKGYTYVKGPKPALTLYPHEQVIYGDSADDEDVGRGHNLAGMWLDELAKWGAMSYEAWTNGLLPALRMDLRGDRPRCICTTTPKPIYLLKEWWARANSGDTKYRLTIGSTYENASNLSPDALTELARELEGTRKGRQELHGELLDEVDGALWTRALLDDTRVRGALPPLVRIAIGMDPAGTGSGDEQGLIVVGQAAGGEQYVLADLSRKIAGLAGARLAWNTILDYADRLDNAHARPVLVVEEDYGKKWLKDVMGVAYKELQAQGKFERFDRAPIKMVKASELGGKALRAEPVAIRYELHRIHHYGVLVGLEDQMCTWDESDPKAHSPDRIDALVHACTYLRDQERRTPMASKGLDSLSITGGGTSTW